MAQSLSILGFPSSRRATLFREIVAVLRQEPALGRVKTWRAWEGKPEDGAEIVAANCPAIRLTPQSLGEGYFDNISQMQKLVVEIELAVRGTRFDDLADFWRAVEVALFPQTTDDQNTLRQRWRAAGAQTGVLRIMQPAVDPRPGADEAAMMLATARVTIDYLTNE